MNTVETASVKVRSVGSMSGSPGAGYRVLDHLFGHAQDAHSSLSGPLRRCVESVLDRRALASKVIKICMVSYHLIILDFVHSWSLDLRTLPYFRGRLAGPLAEGVLAGGRSKYCCNNKEPALLDCARPFQMYQAILDYHKPVRLSIRHP